MAFSHSLIHDSLTKVFVKLTLFSALETKIWRDQPAECRLTLRLGTQTVNRVEKENTIEEAEKHINRRG